MHVGRGRGGGGFGLLAGGEHRKALACGCCSYDQGRSKIDQKCRRGGQIVMHRRQCGVGGLSGTTFPTGKSPLYGETFRAVLVACKQHGMGARVQGKRFSHQPLGFEPGAAHRALAAGRCCGGRHGADAQNGPAVSRARSQPRAQPVGGTAPAGRRTRAISKSSDRRAASSERISESSDFGNAFEA